MGRLQTGRREEILSLALQRFTTDGYTGTTIGDLAGTLGISKAAISYYFPAKLRLMRALVDPYRDELLETAERWGASRHPTAICESLHEYLDVIIRHHEVAVWVDRDPAVQAEYESDLSRVMELMTAAIIGRTRRTRDRIRALSVLGGIWRPARELTTSELDEHRNEIIDAAATSLGP